jgi:hypothetical protein
MENTEENCEFHIISLFNLAFFHILHIFSLFNLAFFHIFHISQFKLLFFPGRKASLIVKRFGKYGRKL